ncbi:MAG: hypothetical protein ACKO96_47710, partial [Flammeovirgaceae bacterium]
KYQTKAKDLYDYFIQKIPSRPEGSLEIPNFFLDRNYTKYFFYTTELEFWQSELQRLGFEGQKITQIHQIVQDDQSLSNANFVYQYGVLVPIKL